MNNFLIRGARLLGQNPEDLAIRDGVFIPSSEVDASSPRTTLVEADGLVALPGLVDLHTHLRQPGMEHAETILTGSKAAAAGGFTAVHAMANTQPVADSSAVTDLVWRLGRQAGYVDVRPVGAVTKGLDGQELAAIGSMARGRAQVKVFSDDGHCVSDSLVMRRAMEYISSFGGVLAQHAQDPRLTEDAQVNEGALSARLGLAGWPAVAEEAIIARDILLAQYTGASLHICHLSTAGSVELIRQAKLQGIAVTAEVTPHHLLLTEDLAENFDPVFKVNPPLRTASDVHALRLGVSDGTIDIIATDHAPHPAEAKDCAFDEASFGMLGLETALSVVQSALVDTGLLDWAGVARVMSTRPAAIGQVDGYSAPFAIGAPAHLTLVDPTTHRPGQVEHSRSRNNPYQDLVLPGKVIATFYRGNATVLGGNLVETEIEGGGGAP